MAVRDFDGTNDSIVLDNGAIGAFNEAGDSHTIVAILKPALTANPQAAFSIRAGVTSDNMASLYFADDGTTHNGTDDPSGVSYTGSGFVDTSWQIVAVSKGAGTVAARFHRKVLGSGSWSHTDGTGTIGTTTSSASECRVGEFSNTAGDYDGLIAVIAFYTTVLSDGQIETIQTTPSTQTLLDLGAVGLWEFNQESTALSVVDRTGFGADQTAITGTTVVTGDDPPGWTFAEALADSLLYSTAGGKGFTQGSVAGNGAFSTAAIVKRTGDASSTYGWVLSWAGSTAYVLGTIFPDAGGVNTTLATYNGSTERNAAPTMLVLYNEWYLIGLSKASGTTTPRYHLYRYSTDEWEHGNYDGTMANYPAPSGGVEWASAGGESWIGNILVGALWDSELADATFETLAFSKPAWIDASPDEAVRFDTTGTITPFVGTSTQFGSTGGALDVGDSPDGWSDEEEGYPAGSAAWVTTL